MNERNKTKMENSEFENITTINRRKRKCNDKALWFGCVDYHNFI